MNAQTLYNSLPVFLQHVLCSIYGYKVYRQRHLKKYAYLYEKFKDSQFWDEKRIEEYQNKQFIKIVQYAYWNNDYYKRKYKSHGVNIDNIKDLRDINQLPTMSKADMREVYKCSKNNKKHIRIFTSGSTGTPLAFRTDYEALNMYYALWKRYKERFGINNRSKKVVFGGKMVVPIKQRRPPFWRFNMFSKQYYFSTQHMSEDNLDSIIDKLIDIQPEEIFSYPSALNIIASARDRIDIPSLKIINLTCENVLAHQRKNIEETFNCRVSQTYGLAEPVIFFEECNKYHLHQNFEFGYFELIDKDGKRSDSGEIVITGYFNKIMPFIRYRSSDVGNLGIGSCGCNRKSKYLISVDGRIEDYIYTPDGHQVGRMSHIFKGEDINVVESQFVQKTIDEVEIHIVPGNNYKKETENLLLENLYERLGHKMKFKFVYKNSIDKTQSGKLRAVISYL